MQLILAIIIALIVFAIQYSIYKKYWNKNLGISLAYSTHYVYCYEPVTLTETINNNKLLPLPIIHIKFKLSRTFKFAKNEIGTISDYHYRNDGFSIMGKQKIVRVFKFTTTSSGLYTIEDITAESRDLFMSSLFNCVYPCKDYLYVFPAKVPAISIEAIYNRIIGEYEVRNNTLEDPFLFKNIRDYQSYDSFKNINWKAYAKLSAPMVNTYFPSSTYDIRIFLNMNTETIYGEDAMRESLISCASTLSSMFINDKIPVSIYVNCIDIKTEENICIASGSGSSHIYTIDKALSRLDIHGDISDFSSLAHDNISTSDTSFFVIISNDRREYMIRLYEDLINKQVPVYYLVPEVKSIPLTPFNDNMSKWEVEAYE